MKKSKRLVDGDSSNKSPKLVRCTSLRENREEEEPNEEAKKLLYVFFRHHGTVNHSLYALDVPAADPVNTSSHDDGPTTSTTTTVITTTTTTVTTTMGTTTSTSSSSLETPHKPRTTVHPVLVFDSHHFPQNMSCGCLGKNLYFVGGAALHYDDDGRDVIGKSLSTRVFILDLTSVSSVDDLRSSYQDSPMQILKPGPLLHTGKVYQEVFAAGDRLFVLSGQRFCPYTGVELKQLEYLDTTAHNPQWEVGSTPPFDNILLGPLTVLDDMVIIRGTRRGTGEPVVYSYDFKEDAWPEFDETRWTSVTLDDGFFFSSGSQWMGDLIYSSYVRAPNAIPLLIRLHRHDEEETLVLDDDEFHDVVRYRILCRELSCLLVRLDGTRLGFLQAGNPPPPSGQLEDFNPLETHLSLAISDAFGGERGGKSVPKYLTSVHFVTYPGRTFTIDNAYYMA